MLSFTYSGTDVSTPMPSTEHSGEANGPSHQTSPPKKNPQIQYPISNIQSNLQECRYLRGEYTKSRAFEAATVVWNQKEYPCMSESANCKSTSQRSQNLLFSNGALREFRCFLFPISLSILAHLHEAFVLEYRYAVHGPSDTPVVQLWRAYSLIIIG